MDPALQELIRAGRSDDEVAVLLRLDGSAMPQGVRVVARFGRIATARVIRSAIPRLHEAEEVCSVKAPRLYVPDWQATGPMESEAGEIRATDERRPAGLQPTGRGVVVALVDWGLDVAHPDFRNADGSSRVLALWDQRARADGRSNNHYGYGWVHDRHAINAALASSDPYGQLAYDPADASRGPTHGAHTAGIAAGNGRGGGPSGMAPDSDIVFVHLATATGEQGDNLGDSAALFEAVHFVAQAAGSRPWVLNTSLGRHAGPHDQSPLIVQGIDAALAEAPGRACVQSTGNYYSRPIHTQGVLRPGEVRDIRFFTGEEDGFAHEIDSWYAGGDRITIEVVAPGNHAAGQARTGEHGDLILGGEKVGRIYNRFRDPNNFDNQALVFLDATAPRGAWILRLRGDDVVDGRYHCWVERDPACSTCQPSFDPADVVPLSTTGTICNGLLTIAVGAYDPHSPERRLAHFSSAGPTREGRVKPDLVAPGVDILSARSAGRPFRASDPRTVRMSGTSMASPCVAGLVALMFEAAGQLLPVRKTRELLLSTAEPLTSGESQFRWGSGYVDVREAVAAAADMNSRSGSRRPKPFVSIPRRAADVEVRSPPYAGRNSRPANAGTERIDGGSSTHPALAQHRRSFMETKVLIQGEETGTENHPCGCRKVGRDSSVVTLQQILAAPGSFARRWRQPRASGGFEIIARPGEPLSSHPLQGDILIRIVEGGAGHAAVITSSGLWHAGELESSGLPMDRESAEGFVHVVQQTPFSTGLEERRARGITDHRGRLLEDLLLLRLATPPAPAVVTVPPPTMPLVVSPQPAPQQPLAQQPVPQQPAPAPFATLATQVPDPSLDFSAPVVAVVDAPRADAPQIDAPQEDELSCTHIDAARLAWPGASGQQLDLMRRVYLRQVNASCQLRHFIGDVAEAELAEIENGVRARQAAADSCRTLLAAARDGLRSDPAAADVRSIGIVSGYRSASVQLASWNRTFPRYFNETQADRAGAEGGEFGDAAAALLTRYISRRLAAPGFSLHNDGRAIDFSTVQGGKSMGADTSQRSRTNWRASWFFAWLMGNANGYSFFQNTAIDEPWHWEFRQAAPATQSIEAWTRSSGNSRPFPDTVEPGGEAEGIAAAEQSISSGRQEFRNTPLLATHRGTQPDLILRWNDMVDPASVDVVVHLHGYSSDRDQMSLLGKERYSGLDFSNPENPSDTRPGRSTPTLCVLPRGSYTGDAPGARNRESYGFPALVTGGGAGNLVNYALGQFPSASGISYSPPRGRLILTAHSGGGEALLRILADVQPDEVHIFDALYWDAGPLISWVNARIAAEIANWSPGKTRADGALCILYRKKGTEGQSVRVYNAIQRAIAAAPAYAQAVLRSFYRVLRTPVPHPEIPRRFGWMLLANAAGTLGETATPSQAESYSAGTAPWERASGGVLTMESARSADRVGVIPTSSAGPARTDGGAAAPGAAARQAVRTKPTEGVTVIAGPGQTLRTQPMPGDVVIRMSEGVAGHSAVVASHGVIEAERLAARGLRPVGEASPGYVHVVESVPAARSSSNGIALGLTDGAGRLLEDLVLLRLATMPTAGTVVQAPAADPAPLFPSEDAGDGSPFASQALEQCWPKAQSLRRTLTAADNPSQQSRMRIGSESRVSVDTNPYSSLRREQLDAVIRASFSSHQAPHTLLALWAKEGSLKMTTSATPVPLATTADNARSLFRSNTYYVDLGSDHFIVTRYDPAVRDNVWDNTDAAAPTHESHFRSRVAALVAPGLLTQDLSGAINAELSVSSSRPFTVTPSIKFYALSLLLMDALFTSMQRGSFPQLSSISEPLNYLQWNIGTRRFGEFLVSAEGHRNEPAFRQPSGEQISLEGWALHTAPRSTEWNQARINAIRFMHYQDSYRPIFAQWMNLITPGVEDLPSLRKWA